MKFWLLLASLVVVDQVKTNTITINDRVSLVYHPSDFVESTGGMAVRRADLGYRAIGYDGTNAFMLAANNQTVFFEIYGDYLGNPRDLVFSVPPGDGRVGFQGVETEDSLFCSSEHYLHALVNGQEVLIPYYDIAP